MNRAFPAFALSILFAALPAMAQQETYTVDPQHTFPAFEINHFGYSLQRGRFDKTTGTITMDRAARKGSVNVVIDAASINTGVPKLEEHLRSEDFFNVAKHPTITFRSSSVAFEGDKVKSVAGDLTMVGVTRPVTLTGEMFQCAPNPMLKKMACGGDFVTRIKRSDWGMKYALPGLADDVVLRINVEAIKD
jgi:polyisoprenoid-binding protein YceI